MASPVITDELRGMIGVETGESVAEVTAGGCRLFARAVGHTDPVFYDEAVARQRGYRAIVAPPGYLGTAVYRPRAAGGDSSPRAHAGPAIPYKRILDGGTTHEYFEPVVAGDVITSRSKITGYQERHGSSGSLLITSRETTFRRQDGTAVARTYSTTISY